MPNPIINRVNITDGDHSTLYDIQDARIQQGYQDSALVMGTSYGVDDPSAGVRVLSWSAVSHSGLVYTFTLNGSPSASVPSGALVSIKAGYSWSFAGTLTTALTTSSSQAIVTLLSSPQTGWSPEQHLDGYLWFPEHPGAGNTPSGQGATSVGAGNKANALGSLASGFDNIADGEGSFTAGCNNKAGYCGSAVGSDNEATGKCAHAEGYHVVSSGDSTHAEGSYTQATAGDAHAEGNTTTASGLASHAEGGNTSATMNCAHAEGYNTTASGHSSHAEGRATVASGIQAHAEGNQTTANEYCAHAEGDQTTASGSTSHAEGASSTASGTSSHAEGDSSTASGNYTHAEGKNTTASGENSHAEGCQTTASGRSSHAQGEYSRALGNYSHAGGYNTTAGAKGWHFDTWWITPDDEIEMDLCNLDGTVPDPNLFTIGDILSAKAGFSANYSMRVTDVATGFYPQQCKIIAKFTDEYNILLPGAGAPFDPNNHLHGSQQPGYIWIPSKPDLGTVPIGTGAMAIGYGNKANEFGSFAIGSDNEVDGRYGFANGENNKVAYSSVAIGHNNNVFGYDSIAVGSYNTTRNWRTAAFGQANSMNAFNGFASGHGNNATRDAHDGISIRGTYAVNQTNDTFIDVVGGGTDNDHRANASALTPAGNYRIKGDIFIKCNPDSSGGTNLRTAIDAKEDKGTFNLLDEVTISADVTGDYTYQLPAGGMRCVLVWLSFPRNAAESFRIFANNTNAQNGGQIAVTAGSGVCNVKMKFDCTHGVLESEWARFESEYGGYAPTPGKTTYVSYLNEPVMVSSVTKIIIRNIATSPNNIIHAGTKFKIYAY